MIEILASLPPVGVYLSPFKTVVLLIFVVPWLYFSPWVQRDAKSLHVNELFWGGGVLAAGALAFLIWLIVPVFLIGMLLYLVIVSAAMGTYVIYRNGRVSESAKVLTGGHFRRIFTRHKAATIEIPQLVKLYDCHDRIVLPPNSAQAPPELLNTFNHVQQLLREIAWRRASRVDLSPAGQQTRVRFEIDGVVTERPALHLADSEAIIQYLKLPAGMDVQERRRPQQGKISVDLVEGQHHDDLIVSAAGSTGGQRMQLAVISETAKTDLENLGMSDDVLQQVKAMSQSARGIIIVSGRPKSGVTSTLYSLLRQNDAFMYQLVSLEKEVVVDLENITQHPYRDESKLPDALASLLRRDPDVIMLDSCNDESTASQACEAAERKNFLVGIQANDAFTALAKWVKVCPGAAAAMKNLHGVLCQILLRKVCPSCREAYHPDPQLLAKANLPADKIEYFYRPPSSTLVDENGNPRICPACQGSGYVGRTAAFELLVVTDELRQLVAGNASLAQIKAACRKNKMLYLQEQALRKVINGITSIQEIIRVTQAAKKP